MTTEELLQAKKAELTRVPSDEEVAAAVRQDFVNELASKLDRVNQLESELQGKKDALEAQKGELDAELETARQSLSETEATVASFDVQPEVPAENTEEVQG